MSDGQLFDIPLEWQAWLQHRPCRDVRSDEEVIASLGRFEPVHGEKNLWFFWEQGLDAMPGWCRRNVALSVRTSQPNGWAVRLIDCVDGSSNHWSRFIPSEMMHPPFVKGTMDGPYRSQHAADAVRGACLYLHGGVFMDVGCLLISDLDRICWNALDRPDSPARIAVSVLHTNFIANYFVAARRHDPFIRRWHELFMHLWSTPADRTNYEGMFHDPLLEFARNIDYDASREAGFRLEWKVEPSVAAGYVAQILCWERMTMLSATDAELGFTGADHWEKHALVWSAMAENWRGEMMFDWNYAKIMRLLTMQVMPRTDSSDYEDAQKLVWTILAKASLQKVARGKDLTAEPALGMLWDMPENEGIDCKPGTFAHLLRWGAENLEQTKHEISYQHPIPARTRLYKGFLEP